MPAGIFRFAPSSICEVVFQLGQKKCGRGFKYVDVQANLALFWCNIRTSSIRPTLIVGWSQQRRIASLFSRLDHDLGRDPRFL
jgi:hypothetical protein